jgi:hypothetical protein
MRGITYLSGPISGCPNGNKQAFHAMSAVLISQGVVTLNPHVLCEDMGADSTQEDYLKVCLKAVLSSNRVLLLEGWERSRGAHVEVIAALKAGIPVHVSKRPADGILDSTHLSPSALPDILNRAANLEKEHIIDTLR